MCDLLGVDYYFDEQGNKQKLLYDKLKGNKASMSYDKLLNFNDECSSFLYNDIEGNIKYNKFHLYCTYTGTLLYENNKTILEFVEENKDELKKITDKGIKIIVKLITAEDEQYITGQLLLENDKIFIIDNQNSKVQINNFKLIVEDVHLHKIIENGVKYMTLKDYLDLIKNNDGLKLYEHRIKEWDSSIIQNELCVIKYNNNNFEFKDNNNNIIPIDKVQKFYDRMIIQVRLQTIK